MEGEDSSSSGNSLELYDLMMGDKLKDSIIHMVENNLSDQSLGFFPTGKIVLAIRKVGAGVS